MQQQALTHAVSIEEGGPANGDTAIYVDGSPSDPSQFFDILDLPHPQKGGTPKDLEIYFGNGAFTTGVVNPYHSPPSNEPLIPFQQLPLIQFTSKIKTLCPSSKLVTLANFNFDHHYELGHCLIWEKKDKIPRNPGKQPRLKVHRYFHQYDSMLRVSINILIIVTSLICLLIFFLDYSVWISGSISPIPPFILTLVSILLIIFLEIYGHPPVSKRGVLRYLRVLGPPLVEEIMISYGWQNGLSQDVRCIARALLQSGIGVWIDVLKLTTGDRTSQTTRTTAAHARFILVVLTTRYINSANCFSEIYEALVTADPQKRVVIFCPDEALYSSKLNEQDVAKVKSLSKKLYSKGLRVIHNFPDLADFLNRHVIYSVDQSHFVWWQKHVGPSSGVPVEYAPPDGKYTSSLSRFNFKIFCILTFKSHGDKTVWRNELPFRIRKNGHMTHIKRIKISNVWISGDLSETGQNASAFPWRFFAFVSILFLPVGDLFINSGSGTVLASIASRPAPLIFIIVMLIMLSTSGLLLLSGLLDRRIHMDSCLRPLMATNNFNPAKKAPNRWVGGRRPRWARAEEMRRVLSTESIDDEPNYHGSVLRINTDPKQKSVKVFPRHSLSDNSPTSALKLFVAVHDFATNHIVASNLRRFLHKIGFRQPRSDSDYGHHSTIVVHIFVFGGGITSSERVDEQKEIIGAQVTTFNSFLIKNSLHVDDCVLIGAGADTVSMELPGLFQAPLKFPEQADSTLGDYLLLLGSALGKSLGEEVFLQTGLRVKNALMRYAKTLKE